MVVKMIQPLALELAGFTTRDGYQLAKSLPLTHARRDSSKVSGLLGGN